MATEFEVRLIPVEISPSGQRRRDDVMTEGAHSRRAVYWVGADMLGGLGLVDRTYPQGATPWFGHAEFAVARGAPELPSSIRFIKEMLVNGGAGFCAVTSEGAIDFLDAELRRGEVHVYAKAWLEHEIRRSMSIMASASGSFVKWNNRRASVQASLEVCARSIYALERAQNGYLQFSDQSLWQPPERLSDDGAGRLIALQAAHGALCNIATSDSIRPVRELLAPFNVDWQAMASAPPVPLADNVERLLAAVSGQNPSLQLHCVGSTVPTTPDGRPFAWSAPARLALQPTWAPLPDLDREGEDEFYL